MSPSDRDPCDLRTSSCLQRGLCYFWTRGKLLRASGIKIKEYAFWTHLTIRSRWTTESGNHMKGSAMVLPNGLNMLVPPKFLSNIHGNCLNPWNTNGIYIALPCPLSTQNKLHSVLFSNRFRKRIGRAGTGYLWYLSASESAGTQRAGLFSSLWEREKQREPKADFGEMSCWAKLSLFLPHVLYFPQDISSLFSLTQLGDFGPFDLERWMGSETEVLFFTGYKKCAPS